MRFCVQLLYFVTLINSAYYFSLLRCCIIYNTKTTLCDHLRGLHILPTLINNFIALLTALLHCFRKECVWGTRLFCSHSLSTQPIKEMNNIFCYLKYCILIPLEAILLPYNFIGEFFFTRRRSESTPMPYIILTISAYYNNFKGGKQGTCITTLIQLFLYKALHWIIHSPWL